MPDKRRGLRDGVIKDTAQICERESHEKQSDSDTQLALIA